MTDLTAITTPWGLLDDATREALKAHGGPYEYWNAKRDEWREPCGGPDWFKADVYRVKPQPPKPREVWTFGWMCTREEAEESLRFLQDQNPDLNFGALVCWREVLP